MRVLGVDPGLEGALAIVEDGALIWAAKIPWEAEPITPVGGVQKHPVYRLRIEPPDTDIEWHEEVWIEHPLVATKHGVGNPVLFAHFGQLIDAYDVDRFVRPDTWQSWAFAGLRRQIQTDAYRSIGLPAEGLKDETLWFSRLAALIYFGEEAVRRWCVPAGSRVLHDGLTDAALIALYGWCRWLADECVVPGADWRTRKLQAAWPEFFQARAPLAPSTGDAPFGEDE